MTDMTITFSPAMLLMKRSGRKTRNARNPETEEFPPGLISSR